MHPWNVTPKEAVEIQKDLRSSIKLTPLAKEVQLIAGADVSMERFGDTLYAGITILSFPDLREIEHALVKTAITFPYVPGLLSFREIPALIKAWGKLENKPDVVMVDGHGTAHPRRMGIATHFGLLTHTPTIGCAKRILTGTYEEPEVTRGSVSSIYDDKEPVGTAVRTKDGVKPVFTSPGDLITHDEAVDLVLATTRGYRLPEPTRQAHLLVNRFRRGEIKE